MSRTIVPPAPYGIKAIRQIRSKPKDSGRLTKKINDTYSYFLEKVDPVIGDCITYLLNEQPYDVPRCMLKFLVGEGIESRSMRQENTPTENDRKKPRAELKLFLATSIGPLIAKLVNRIALDQPQDVKGFLISELKEIIANEAAEDLPLPAVASRATSAPANRALSTSNGTTKANSSSVLIDSSAKNTVTSGIPVSDASNIPPPEVAKVEKNLQIAVIGLGGAGKSSLLNILQGDYQSKPRPTGGFRPIAMKLSEEIKIRFYDLGGGKRIRGIWGQYYNDVHAVLFVIDGSLRKEEDIEETVQSFKTAINQELLKGKPFLVMVNKQDVEGAVSADMWKQRLVAADDQLAQALNENKDIIFTDCSGFISDDSRNSPETYQPDGRIESSLESLLEITIGRYDELNERVTFDMQQKAIQEAEIRIAREKKVLKNKIASAFIDDLNPKLIEELKIEAEPERILSPADGLEFIASEIGEEIDALPKIARQIVASVGYQQLAMQIIGALKAPISKKKTPLSWDEIAQIVSELRVELGFTKLVEILDSQ